MPSAATVLACALALLGRSETTMPPIKLVDVPHPQASAHVEAYVRDSDDTIYVVTSSRLFRTAQSWNSACGDLLSLKKLASVLAHEEWHVRHGKDERSAYYAQLTTLVQLGVEPGSAIYASVVRSMLAVSKKRNQKPELIVADNVQQ